MGTLVAVVSDPEVAHSRLLGLLILGVERLLEFLLLIEERCGWQV